jgi:hypothetical protein
MPETIFETPAKFAKRSGLSLKFIIAGIKQGIIPHIKIGKSHVMVEVLAATESLRVQAINTAAQITERMPLFRNINLPEKEKKKFGGRLPDAIRLANKNSPQN